MADAPTVDLDIPYSAEERARMSDAAQAKRQMTYGEKLVGITFNPSGDEKVTRLKTLFAEIVDICADELAEVEEADDSPMTREAGPIWREAIMRSLDAQMWTVKGATWRK